MIVGFPKETFPGERRVAVIPDTVPLLTKAGLEVLVESGAGEAAGWSDPDYAAKGATIVPGRAVLFEQAGLIVHVRAGGANPDSGRVDLPRLDKRHTVVAACDPLSNPGACQAFAETGATLFALELIPRSTRAQRMDVLSSMATVAGYRAVLLAAEALPRVFPMLMTAAGTLKPAQVLVIGAGVAGLQAIATARRLGAVVSGYDIRPSAREEIASLGAKVVVLDLETQHAQDAQGYARSLGDSFVNQQNARMAPFVAGSDVVIATAAVPGKIAPLLVTEPMVRAMRPGSVIVDLAVERGGNCELTEAGKTVVVHGVRILGPLNVPSDVPAHASQLFARNVVNFLLLLVKDGKLNIDESDDIVKGTLVARGGFIVNERMRELLTPPAPKSGLREKIQE